MKKVKNGPNTLPKNLPTPSLGNPFVRFIALLTTPDLETAFIPSSTKFLPLLNKPTAPLLARSKNDGLLILYLNASDPMHLR